MQDYYTATILKDKGFETASDVILNLELLPDVVIIETEGKKKIIADSVDDFMSNIKNLDNRDAFERISRLMNAQSKVEHQPCLYNNKTNEHILVSEDEYKLIRDFKFKPQKDILNIYRDTLAMILLGNRFKCDMSKDNKNNIKR